MRAHAPVALLVAVATVALTAFNGSAQQKAFDAASDAWDKGNYIAALEGYLAFLNGVGGDAFLEPIALQTGELYQSSELTSDGRAPRVSADGRFIAFETGLEVSRRTKVVRNDATLSPVADLAGVSLTFAPSGDRVGYLKIAAGPDLTAAAAALEAAPLAAQNRNALIQAFAWQVMRHSVVTIRDLDSGREQELPALGLLKTGLAFGADGRRLFFLGGTEADETRNDIYAIAEGQDAVVVGGAPGLKGVPVVAANGAAIVYVPTPFNPLRRPGAPGGQGGGAPAAPRGPSFGIIDLARGTAETVDGSAPALSADGTSLAYIARAGDEYQLMLGATLGARTAVKKTAARLDAPAWSPDGQRLAFQQMARDDWEIFVAARDGSGETRLTRDIQHDVVPRFIAADRIVAAVGEARHRRSFLYDLTAGTRTRLFHNNTVRTIAPEYQWTPAPDGASLLIVAERDGNTVSPERGVYRLDLQRKVSKADVVRRLERSLANERALRAGAVKAYEPIAATVRKVVDAVSVERIFGYEKALFDFDSKHITRPGNKLAADYLFNAYKSFGYEPEQQWFDNRVALGGKTANVIATLKGTVNPELVYVVSSHYDSVAGGPGADDDSSGTAALLEAARVLADHPMPATIVFASFTGEESGLLGSREYVRRAVESKTQIVGALNNDMIGWSENQRLDNTIRYSNPGIRDIQHGAAMLFTRLVTYDALYFKSTDAAAYYDAYGDIVGGIGSYPVLSNPHYHQAHDLLEFENHQLIAETSKTTAATLMLLASSPSRIRDLRVDGQTAQGTTVSWSPSPEKGVASYIVEYGHKDGAAAAMRRMSVTTTRVSLPALTAGATVAVKAVTKNGLEGWDWARLTIGSRPQSDDARR
jgi:hypothetical protein